MKKIIAAFDGLKYSTATEGYATQLTKNSDSHLAGVFLEDKLYTSYSVYQLLVKKDVPEKKLAQYEQKDKDQRDNAVKAFSKSCDKAAITYSVHRDHHPALHELLHETVFADLLIIDKHETFTHYEEKPPTRFIRDLLVDAQCPVLLVSETYHPPDKIIVLYDGHPSSVYALKMFSYLFKSLGHLPLEIFSCKHYFQDRHLPDNKLMKEFVKKHFPKAVFKILKGNQELEITTYLVQQPGNPLVVLGAYGRGMISRWYKTSTADLLMDTIKFPMFIAHHHK